MASSSTNAAELNARFLRYIEERFPQWLPHVRVLRDEDANEDYLELTVPDPPGISHDHPLGISTWGEEITISFGDFHTHFPWPLPLDHNGLQSTNEMSDLIRALLDEDLVTLSVWSKGRCKLGSTTSSASLDTYRLLAPGDHEMHIKSWRGTYNAILPVDWQAYLQTYPDDLQIHLKGLDP